MESISEFNNESNDFNSLLIHLGVLLKKSLSTA